VPALGTERIGGVDHYMALRALLGGGLAVAGIPVLDAQRVDGAVPQDVAPEVQHEAVRLARVETEASANHLVIQARRVGRPQQDTQSMFGAVEAGGQHVHIDQVLEVAFTKALQRLGPLERQRLATDEPAFVAPLAQHALHVQRVLHASGKDQDAVAIPGLLDDLLAGEKTSESVSISCSTSPAMNSPPRRCRPDMSTLRMPALLRSGQR